MYLMICLYELLLPHMSYDPIPLSGTHPVIFIYLGSLASLMPVLSPRPWSSHALQSEHSRGMPRGSSAYLVPSQGHCPELPDLCGLQILLLCISVTTDGEKREKREKRANQSPSSSSARSRSVIFLDTKVFPKLVCVLSSEKLIKNKDSWASTQNS